MSKSRGRPTPPDAAQILHDRARKLARPLDQPAAAETAIEVLEFRLAQERYGIETRYIREVSPLKDLTPLPCTPAFIRGIVNVRGRILPVIDLKRFFDLSEEGLTDLHRIILIESDDVEIGLLADAAVGVRLVPHSALQPSLPTLTGIRADYLKGVTAGSLVVLDAGSILADPKIIVHDEVES